MRLAWCLFAIVARPVFSCRYGTLPVAWTRHEWPAVHGRGHTLDYNRLDNTPSSVWLNSYDDAGGPPFGAALTSLDPLCPIKNLIQTYFDRTRPAVNRTILFLGDSLDSQILDFVCIRASTNSNVQRWFAFVHSHRNVNYCRIERHDGTFLSLVQMYLVRNSVDDDTQRVDTVRRFFDNDDSDIVTRFDGTNRTCIDGRIDETAIISKHQPDLIVFGGVYWPLHRFTDAMGENVSVMLPVQHTKTFMHETNAVLEHIAVQFSEAHIVLRNSPEIRTDLMTGSNIDGINKRTWGRKSYVTALNEALKHVARIRMLDLFDLYTIGSYFQPMQLTGDDIHPNAWFQFELLNLYLNSLREHAA